MASVEYIKELYTEGNNIYNEIKEQISAIKEKIADSKNIALTINSADAAFNYDGIYQETFNNASQAIDDLDYMLGISSIIVNDAKTLVEKYNNGEVPESIFKQLMGSLKMRYNLLIKNRENVPIDSLKYTEIYDEKYIPQGITVVDDMIIISAYTHGGQPKLFMYDKNTKELAYSVLLNDVNDSHVGGVTYDKNNGVLIVTGTEGNVNVFDYKEMQKQSKVLNQYNDGKPVELDLNDETYSSIKLKSNININYNTYENGKKITDYNAGTVYYDNKTGKLYMARFSNNGKVITGDLQYDRENGTYNLVNPQTVNVESGVQGLSTYQKDGKEYLVETRSYGGKNTVLTVRDITNGIENSTVVGSKTLDNMYGEGIQVDKNGNAIILYEEGKSGHYENTQTVNVNSIIEEHNGQVPEFDNIEKKWDSGDPNGIGY